jgi:hypothetical protein
MPMATCLLLSRLRLPREIEHSTQRYLCVGRRAGHQLGIVAGPVDELVKEFVLGSRRRLCDRPCSHRPAQAMTGRWVARSPISAPRREAAGAR